MPAVVGGQIQRHRETELAQYRVCMRVEIIRAVCEREGDTPGRQFVLIHQTQCFIERKYSVTSAAQHLEALSKRIAVNVQTGVPTVFVFSRDAVIAEDQKALRGQPGTGAEKTP